MISTAKAKECVIVENAWGWQVAKKSLGCASMTSDSISKDRGGATRTASARGRGPAEMKFVKAIRNAD